MTGGIFISYRRDDSQHAAGRLVDRLSQSFGKDRIFMDVDAIEPGLDFLDVINAKVAESFVFLVVIGLGWVNAAGPEGRRRLDHPDDLVRLEIEAGLKRDIRVIPVLVDGAPMPSSGDLPPSLQGLVRRGRASGSPTTPSAVTPTGWQDRFRDCRALRNSSASRLSRRLTFGSGNPLPNPRRAWSDAQGLAHLSPRAAR